MLNQETVPEKYLFKDNGIIPNSKYPVLIYRNVFTDRGIKGAEWLEQKFKQNNWYNSWRWGIYPFHHYHSNTHETLGVFQGFAKVLIGGFKGKKVKISAGDIIIIPAGVGHKCLRHSEDFTVVGAYAEGKEPDLVKESETVKRDAALKNITEVPIPSQDPLMGNKGLVHIWK
ncbi:MAG: cupin protein [Chryseobacterium sp.]|jgi:uncharacterized protein YjlB|nr:cupin protein [Chryseobacterium sp.]